MSTIATQIRDAAFIRLKKAMSRPSGAFRTVRRVPALKLQPDQIPFLGVFLMREDLNADGDENVSVPKFVGDVTLAVSAVFAYSDDDTLDGALDDAVDQIEDVLLSDPSFVSLVDHDGNALIEGFSRLTRSYSFPHEGDAYYAEARLNLTARVRMVFPPVLPHDLLEIDTTISPAIAIPGAATPNLKVTLPGA